MASLSYSVTTVWPLLNLGTFFSCQKHDTLKRKNLQILFKQINLLPPGRQKELYVFFSFINDNFHNFGYNVLALLTLLQHRISSPAEKWLSWVHFKDPWQTCEHATVSGHFWLHKSQKLAAPFHRTDLLSLALNTNTLLDHNLTFFTTDRHTGTGTNTHIYRCREWMVQVSGDRPIRGGDKASMRL